ncbi:MAG: hypothetical protein ABJF04_13820 [Reichenbachiella sp.]|uniref:hypothetical protein n=1 Tax=Reichenbachiella sp. TaxID=2184521 RepID=UPI003266EF03
MTTFLALIFAQSCIEESLEMDRQLEPEAEKGAAYREDFVDEEGGGPVLKKVPYEILIQFDHGNQLNSNRDVYVENLETGAITLTHPRSTEFYKDGQGNKFNWSGDINDASGHSYYFNLGSDDQGEYRVYTLDNLGNASFKNALELYFHSSNAPDVRIAYKPSSVGFQFSGGNNPESLEVIYKHYNPVTVQPPTLISPANGASLSSSSATFSWSSVTGATSYTLNIDGGTYTTASTSYTKSGLSNDSHTWKVRTNSASGPSAYSASRSFSVSTASPLTASISGPSSISLPTKKNPAKLKYRWTGYSSGGSGNKTYKWYENGYHKYTGKTYEKEFSYNNTNYYFTIELRVTDDNSTVPKFKTIQAIAGGGGGELEF